MKEVSINLPLVHKGKVRDIYNVDDQHLLFVTTDRLSAFDVVFDQPIPNKGRVLTQVSNFWFEKTKNIVPNHLTEIRLSEVLNDSQAAQLEGRAIVVKKLKPLPVEAIVRGYLIGSGWKDYQTSGSVCGIDLPKDLQMASKLPSALFTPSTKAAVGDHDENIDFAKTVKLLGKGLANQVKDTAIALYQFASDYALERGIIIADTKFEFGLDQNDCLTLMDEALTPDSSRFWSKDNYQIGLSPKSFDKQIIRDYLETLDWDKTPPAPTLPQSIIDKTAQKYQQVQNLLCS